MRTAEDPAAGLMGHGISQALAFCVGVALVMLLDAFYVWFNIIEL